MRHVGARSTCIPRIIVDMLSSLVVDLLTVVIIGPHPLLCIIVDAGGNANLVVRIRATNVERVYLRSNE